MSMVALSPLVGIHREDIILRFPNNICSGTMCCGEFSLSSGQTH